MDADTREPTTLETAWPLFGLRLRSEHLVLRLPTRRGPAGVRRPRPRPGSTRRTRCRSAWRGRSQPSPAFERGFVQHHWLMRATWTPEAWTLNLMVELDGRADRHADARREGVRDPSDGRYRIVARPGLPGSGLRQGDAVRRAVAGVRRPRRAVGRVVGVPRQPRVERGFALARVRGQRPSDRWRRRAWRARPSGSG